MKICVIGAGVMGSGIAAQIANSGTQVLLLDVMPNIAENAVHNMLIGKMPQLAHASLLPLISYGNLQDHLEDLSGYDWIIEVIVENIHIKEQLYLKIANYLSANTVLTSNTSTLTMEDLRRLLPQTLHSRFFLTHFFNPPRYMRLVELIYDNKSDVTSVNNISDFIEHKLGKITVKPNDTPGFIANRIGCFLMALMLKISIENKLDIEFVDRYLSSQYFLPSTGIFGLFDLIGLDVMKMISNILAQGLTNDSFSKYDINYDWYDKMISENYKGRKGLGGFYKIDNRDNIITKLALDLTNFQYKNCINDLDIEDSRWSHQKEFLDSAIRIFLSYVKNLDGIIATNKEDIDKAMIYGYSWKKGPFEIMGEIQKISNREIARLFSNASAYVYEPKDKVLVFSTTTKMNCLNHEIFDLLIKTLEYANSNNYDRVIIYNDNLNFSAGADLKSLLDMLENNDIDQIEQFVLLGQKAMMEVKRSIVPVISCAAGLALGGGCELLLHSHYILADIDLIAGLVETNLGILPAWGGTKEMILKGDQSPAIEQNLVNILEAKRSKNAYDFIDLFSLQNIQIVMNKYHMLEYALNLDLDPRFYQNNNEYYKCIINFDKLYSNIKNNMNNNFILQSLQNKLDSSSLSEIDLLDIEKNIFLSLCKDENLRREIILRIKRVV